MKIEHTLSPEIKDIEFLSQKINEESPNKRNSHSFAFFIRDNKGIIIAGCNGFAIFGCIYTDQLWVHSDHRKLGFGKKLLEEVEKYGKKIGCSMATVSTMSFQNALNFYKKLGYSPDFERSGYVDGATCIFLRKNL